MNIPSLGSRDTIWTYQLSSWVASDLAEFCLELGPHPYRTFAFAIFSEALLFCFLICLFFFFLV